MIQWRFVSGGLFEALGGEIQTSRAVLERKQMQATGVAAALLELGRAMEVGRGMELGRLMMLRRREM